MKRANWISWLVAAVLLSIGLNIYFVLQRPRGSDSGEAVQSAELYVCPMHPQVRQDHPGDCPICGMKLVKQQTAGDSDASVDSIARTVNLDPAQLVLANVKTETPSEEVFVASRIVPGRIVAREDAQWKATARVMGRIEKIHVGTPGDAVRKGQPLYELFSPDLAAAQREYQLADQGSDETIRRMLKSAAGNKLQSLGMEDEQIRHLEETGQIRESLVFHAPRSGVLMEKMAAEGEWTMPGMTLLDFVDLTTVWIEGSLYEQDAARVRIGDGVFVKSQSDASLNTSARISFISPMLDMMSRTLAFRAEVPNPALKWRPEMYVDIEWKEQAERSVLSVPAQAVLVTGKSSRVWIKTGENRFEPRAVAVGPRQNGRTAILAGLKPDDEVVVSGGYLIDSDAQLKDIQLADLTLPDPAADQPAPSSHQPATSPAVQKEAVAGGDMYYCTMCPEITSSEPGRCSKCGMFLKKKEG